jgi:uncharacterized membrane protein
MPERKRIILVYLATAAGSLAWLGGIFLAPYLRSRHSAFSGFVYAIFAPVCHQVAARSFGLWGCPLAVCARCLGIYLGFLAGVGLYPLLRRFRKVKLPPQSLFIAVSVPIVVDTLGNFLKLWSTPNWPRLAIGFLWGVILPFYFITGLAELALHRRNQNNP